MLLIGFVSCNEEVRPKPKGYLSLDYSKPEYAQMKSVCPYTFDKNTVAEIKPPKWGNYCSLDLSYPELKGKIHINYKPVRGNINTLLKYTQDITQEHTAKADRIETKEFVNFEKKLYGLVYEVEGDAASSLQFYVTDSVNHFLSGSVYFNTKPNYDSIYPASEYLKKDVKVLMESLEWQN